MVIETGATDPALGTMPRSSWLPPPRTLALPTPIHDRIPCVVAGVLIVCKTDESGFGG